MYSKPLIRRRAIGLAAAVLATALGLSACSSESPEGAETKEAVLSVSISSAPPSLDPAMLDEGQGTFVWSSVYDTLLQVDNENKIQPGVAETYEYSDDRKTLTLGIREGITFSNGDSLTSADVVATLERTKATPGAQQARLAGVTSITSPDAKTVVLELSAPNATLLNYLAQATGVVGHGPTLKEESNKLRPIGSGPYVITDSTVDGDSYVLERREDYWNAKAFPFKTFTVRVIKDATAAVNAFKTGEIQAATVQPAQLPQLDSAQITKKEVTSTSTMLLLLTDRGGKLQPALADERVRKAINMAFDRDQMVKTLFSGYAHATEQSFNRNGEAFDESLDGTYKYDPEGAKKLLTEAGYPDGFSLRMPSTVISTSFEPVITQALKDIGITAQWEPVPPQNIASSVASGQYPAVLWIEGTNTAGREISNYFTPNAFLNPMKWEDPELNALLAEIQVEPDDAKRSELYKKANALTVEKALNAPIVSINTLWVTAKDIEVVPDVNVPKTIRMFAPSS